MECTKCCAIHRKDKLHHYRNKVLCEDCNTRTNYSSELSKYRIVQKYINFDKLFSEFSEYAYWDYYINYKDDNYIVDCDHMKKLPKDKYKKELLKRFSKCDFNTRIFNLKVFKCKNSNKFLFEMVVAFETTYCTGYVLTGLIDDDIEDFVFLQNGHPVLCTKNYTHYYSHSNEPLWLYRKKAVSWIKETVKEIIENY